MNISIARCSCGGGQEGRKMAHKTTGALADLAGPVIGLGRIN
jgi:hypothetical protein